MFSVFATASAAALALAPAPQTENVVLLMADGLRWQEVFRGAEDNRLRLSPNRVVRERFGVGDDRTRRSTLMPFLWNGIAKKGQVYGNPYLNSRFQVINRLNFSYPGYSETFCGFVDPNVDSNQDGPNPNQTVFEWLHKKPALRGKVAAFGSWMRFAAIFNKKRCGFPVICGFEPSTQPDNAAVRTLNRLKTTLTPPWVEQPYDALTFMTAMEYIKAYRPRVIFIGLGETDVWGHANRYGEYLVSANRFDGYAKEVWQTLQSMAQYRNRTTLILATDHGRGEDSFWTSHGRNIPDSKSTWLAAIGPGIDPRGEMKDTPNLGNAQIASTIAALLGYDYPAQQPRALGPIRSLLH